MKVSSPSLSWQRTWSSWLPLVALHKLSPWWWQNAALHFVSTPFCSPLASAMDFLSSFSKASTAASNAGIAFSRSRVASSAKIFVSSSLWASETLLHHEWSVTSRIMKWQVGLVHRLHVQIISGMLRPEPWSISRSKFEVVFHFRNDLMIAHPGPRMSLAPFAPWPPSQFGWSLPPPGLVVHPPWIFRLWSPHGWQHPVVNVGYINFMARCEGSSRRMLMLL